MPSLGECPLLIAHYNASDTHLTNITNTKFYSMVEVIRVFGAGFFLRDVGGLVI